MSGEIEAIILSGGKGKRLRSVTMDQIPKGLVKIKGKPILEWQLIWLRKYGVKKVIFALGYLAEKVQEYFGEQYESPWGSIDLEYSIEKEKLGSGGAVKLASPLVTSSEVFILNGDVLTNMNLQELVAFHHEKKAIATMGLVKMRSPFGVIKVEDGVITEFVEKPILPVWIHSGVDLFSTELLSRFPDKGQMEDTIFVELSKNRQFMGYEAPDSIYWLAIDTQKEYESANKNFPADTLLP